MEKRSIGFVGGGRITKILLNGFKSAEVEFSNIVVYDPNEETLAKLKGINSDIQTTNTCLDSVAMADVIFVAVHPPMMVETLAKLQPYIRKNAMIVSLAPKITIDKIQSVLPDINSVARVNPNASNIIRQGINPVAFSQTMPEEDKTYLMELLGTLGNTFVVDEPKIEAYAIICAMGSTYFWFQLQHLKELGMDFGLDEEEAKHVLKDMMLGTINTLFFSDIASEEVMDLVPVKPVGEYEETIKAFYNEKLKGIYSKIKP